MTLGLDRLVAVNLRLMDGSKTGERFDAQFAALIQARDEGLIDGIGLSNISRDQLRRAVSQTQIVCVQNLFNLADQRARGVLEDCENIGSAALRLGDAARADLATLSRGSGLGRKSSPSTGTIGQVAHFGSPRHR